MSGTPTDHVEPGLVDAFVRGELGERTATRVALHLDACPRCANLVREADPLARLFASVDDPELPEGLVAAVLAADVGAVPGTPWTELVLGAGMLAAAGLATWASFGADTWWSGARAVGRALDTGLHHGLDVPGAVPSLVAVATVAALGTWWLARIADDTREAR